MNHNSDTGFTLNHINRIMMIIVLLFFYISAQNVSQVATPLSFVFLPLRTTQSFQMEGEQFMDEFIKVLRMRGHNAVSTRYLKSVLLDSRFGVLEACTTQVCMSQLVRLVGTRILLHGSLYSDSTMDCIINLKVIDVPNDKVLTEQCERFTSKNGISSEQIDKFTEKIMNLVSKMLIGTGDESVAIEPAAESSEIQHAEVAVSVLDTVEKNSDYSGHAPGSAEATQNMIADSLVEQATENISATSNTPTLVDTAATKSENVLAINNHEKDSGKVIDTVTLVHSVSTPPQVSLKTPIQEYESSRPAAPPEALKRENVKKKLKIVRISTFGTIAFAAFSGGIAINSLVKRSLDKEGMFYNDYMKADKYRADGAYQTYLLQTEETDARIRQRSFLYTLGVLGLAGGVISLKF
jgi:hypothetical protein